MPNLFKETFEMHFSSGDERFYMQFNLKRAIATWKQSNWNIYLSCPYIVVLQSNDYTNAEGVKRTVLSEDNLNIIL